MNNNTFEDAYNLMCGKLLGVGAHRTVHECNLMPGRVIKIENDTHRYFANVFEMQFWCDNQYRKEVADWLAPCEFLSPDGRILIQKQADPLPLNYKLPSKIPAFITDLKRENFGLIDGKLVWIDYALVINNPSARLKKAEWRD